MVGAWLLGLDVQHTYDSAFCCGDVVNCGHIARRVASVLRQDLSKLSEATGLARAGLQSGRQWRRDLTQLQQTESNGRICALYAGGCNGVCGAEDAQSWEPYRKCVTVV
jgi:hypothetical protein